MPIENEVLYRFVMSWLHAWQVLLYRLSIAGQVSDERWVMNDELTHRS